MPICDADRPTTGSPSNQVSACDETATAQFVVVVVVVVRRLGQERIGRA